MTKIWILLALLIIPAGIYAAMDIYKNPLLDISYEQIEDHGDGSFSLVCVIKTKGSGVTRKRIVVTLEADGRVQEKHFLHDENGEERGVTMYRDYNDPRPLSKLGKELYDDIMVFSDPSAGLGEVGEDKNDEEPSEDSGLRPYPPPPAVERPEKPKRRFFGWFSRKKKGSGEVRKGRGA